ncbi:MAG: hypothetical protein HY819_03725 [Acidobacteria bacterium]|nr:hypothetical protein [Acidobacteriota bacterium]
MRNRELYLEKCGHFILLPVIHHSYEFTLAARLAFEELNPCAIAVEYPFTLQDLVIKAVDRLPRISILLYGDTTKNFIRFEPVDPFIEAVRLARQNHLEVRCIDLSITNYPEIYEPMPDTYALKYLGHKKYCEMALTKAFLHLPEDEKREQAMAFHLKELEHKLSWTGKLNPKRPILVLCGLKHLFGLKEKLKAKTIPRPEENRPLAKLYHLSPLSLGEIMGQFPFFSSVYELQRNISISKLEDNSKTFSIDPITTTINNAFDTFDNLASDTADSSKTVFKVISGKAQEKLPELAPRAHIDVANRVTNLDHNEIIIRYLLWCRAFYEQEIGERLSPQQMFLLISFARKYASVKKSLLPDFYELLIAGRGSINSHFCYRMWELGTFYASQEGHSELETIELRAEDIFPLINKVRMNPYTPLKPRAGVPRFLTRKDKQKQSLKDKNLRFDPNSICSYPPEDIILEGYGNYLRSKGKHILSEERKRVRPFETSLLDGIDLKETIRNWHTGKLYVQEAALIKGSVDSVVVIFDEDTSNYPYTMTWLGEHEQESDMAFYATSPDERHVASGIRKAIYGGFMMSMPPGRLYDVFHDPVYRVATNHAERLLFAALDYSLEKFVVYVAPKPPRPFFQVLAGRYGKRILYISLKQLSPVMLQKIRSFHILSDKSVRSFAKDFIW